MTGKILQFVPRRGPRNPACNNCAHWFPLPQSPRGECVERSELTDQWYHCPKWVWDIDDDVSD